MAEKYNRCTKCILSANFPSIEFDENGVCNFCRNETFQTTEDRIIDRSRKKIMEMIETKKGKGQYDAIMCYSGGKDSTYTLMMAVKEYGLKVLSFSLDNGFISPVTFQNINRVVEHLEVDHITIKPSIKNLKSIFAASALHPIYNPKSLVRISSGCYSCISIVNNSALKLALEKNIPFILAGFTLGQIPANSIIYQNNYKFLQESREPYLNKLREKAGSVVDDYFTISDELIDNTKQYPHNINLLCLHDVSEEDIIKKIKTIGWEAPKDVDGCSSNCMLNTFNNFAHQETFGYNPYELELSHLIRKDRLSREEALEKITNQPVEKIDAIVERLDIHRDDLKKLPEIYKK